MSSQAGAGIDVVDDVVLLVLLVDDVASTAVELVVVDVVSSVVDVDVDSMVVEVDSIVVEVVVVDA